MTKKTRRWPIIFFIGGYHIALFALLPIYLIHHTPSIGIWISSFALFVFSGLSITCGYHRYYSHNSYKTNVVVEAIILFFATLGVQGSAIKWAADHRIHHAFVDTDRDPYSIKKGFWYAHILWLFVKRPPLEVKVIPDLFKNKLAYWQDRLYGPLMILANSTTTLLIGYLFNDYLGAFAISLGLRLFVSQHTTWFINSIAHTWGKQSYSQEHSAMDNFLISFLTFGEGFHNYHHTFANDYRNGIRWFDFDPSKWLIWTLSKLGLASQLKRTEPARIRKHLLEEQKGEILEQVKARFEGQLAPVEAHLTKVANNLVERYSHLQKVKIEYQQLSKESEHEKASLLKKELIATKSLIDEELIKWQTFYKSVMNPSKTLQIPSQPTPLGE